MKRVILIIAIFLLIGCTTSPTQVYHYYPEPSRQPALQQPSPVQTIQQSGFIPNPQLEMPVQASFIGSNLGNQYRAIVEPLTIPAQYYDIEDPCASMNSITGDVTLITSEIQQRMQEGRIFALRFVCTYEKKKYQEMYDMFLPGLRKLRSFKSFEGIMIHRQIMVMQPYSMRIDNIRFFKNATLAYLYLTGDYKIGRIKTEHRREPYRVMRYVGGEWFLDDYHNFFNKFCFVKTDCKITSKCQNECNYLDETPYTTCDPILQECSCSCYKPGRREELKPYI